MRNYGIETEQRGKHVAILRRVPDPQPTQVVSFESGDRNGSICVVRDIDGTCTDEVWRPYLGGNLNGLITTDQLVAFAKAIVDAHEKGELR